MTTSKPLVLAFHSKLNLSMSAFAALAGFAVSFALPLALSCCFSAMHALYRFLPRLWHAYMEGLTPPCLFVVLNGIILLLTATSGVLSDSGLPYYRRKPVNERQTPPKKVSEALTEEFRDTAPSTSLSAMTEGQHLKVLKVDPSAIYVQRKCSNLDADGNRQEGEVHVFDAEDKTDNDVEVHNSCTISNLEKENERFSFSSGDNRCHEVEEKGKEYHNSHNRACKHSVKGVLKTKTAPVCREISLPPSPQVAIPPKPSRIKRSRSVDSAPHPGDQFSPVMISVDTLSDEAFRKRVEEFISQMNAKMRKEVSWSNSESCRHNRSNQSNGSLANPVFN